VPLTIRSCIRIGSKQLPHIRNFTHLKSLRVNGSQRYCELADIAILENLRELELIDFTGGGVSSNEVQAERGFVAQEKSDGRFTKAMGYLRSLPKLRALYLGDTDVPDAALNVIADFPAIEFVDLAGSRGTSIGEGGLDHLSRLKQLRGLRLKGFYISDSSVPPVARIPTIEVLWLSSPEVSDDSIQELATMTELRELNLSETRVTGRELHRLIRLTKLEKLILPTAAKGALAELQKTLPDANISIE
jgi:hypothetical protein